MAVIGTGPTALPKDARSAESTHAGLGIILAPNDGLADVGYPAETKHSPSQRGCRTSQVPWPPSVRFSSNKDESLSKPPTPSSCGFHK